MSTIQIEKDEYDSDQKKMYTISIKNQMNTIK